MLALSFLLLIGMSLILDGVGQHVSKGYMYFAMGFSVFVEMINLRVRSKASPLHCGGASDVQNAASPSVRTVECGVDPQLAG